MLRNLIITVSAALAGWAAAQPAAAETVERERAVGAFQIVVNRTPFDVVLRPGASDRVFVSADEALQSRIETQVQGGKLDIALASGATIKLSGTSRVIVEFTRLEGIHSQGSGDIRVEQPLKSRIFEVTVKGSGDVLVPTVEADAVAVAIAGSGNVRLGGHTEALGINVSGSGDVLAGKLVARTVAVRIRGSGDVEVHASSALSVDIGGSGDVRFRGEPVVSKKVAGSGELIKQP
ncbi:MAG TPA: head GIN domain-containing protein [Burkholderiaceae bacterium]|jgi:hypothetical protein|nr:head GIN domain-containing protein [Burkholderiaceae bacterium]